MNENTIDHAYMRYVRFVDGAGGYVSRSDCAAHFGVHYTTAKLHLERATARGLVRKVPGYIGNQPGWVYCSADLQPELFTVVQND